MQVDVDTRSVTDHVDHWCAHHDIRLSDAQRAAFVHLLLGYEMEHASYRIQHKRDQRSIWLIGLIAFPLGLIVGYYICTFL